MINSLFIKNFKGIQSLNLTDLAPITLLGGMNNIGKSSVLDALFFLYTATFSDLFSRQYGLREMNKIDLGDERIWANFFYNLDTKNSIEIETTSNSTHHRVICKMIPDYPIRRSEPVKTQDELSEGISKNISLTSALNVSFFVNDSEVYAAHTYGRNSEGLVHDSTTRSYQKPLMDLIFLRPMRSRTINARWLSSMDLDNQLDLVIDMLREIEPRIKGLSVISVSSVNEIYVDLGLKRKIPLKLAGDGMAHLLSFVLAIANTPKGIILVDEIENGLHYSIQPKVWKFLMQLVKKFDCQVISTTHSYGMLRAAHEAFKDNEIADFRYIRLERNNGVITGVNFSSKQLDTALELNMEVR